jgi:hypothetical protein
VLLFLRHGGLEGEHVVERAALVVGKDAAHRVRVADVHVPVEEPGGDDHVPRVDDAIRADGGELARLADARDPSTVYEDGSALNDPPAFIDRDEEPRVVDLEGRHGGEVYTKHELEGAQPASGSR